MRPEDNKPDPESTASDESLDKSEVSDEVTTGSNEAGTSEVTTNEPASDTLGGGEDNSFNEGFFGSQTGPVVGAQPVEAESIGFNPTSDPQPSNDPQPSGKDSTSPWLRRTIQAAKSKTTGFNPTSDPQPSDKGYTPPPSNGGEYTAQWKNPNNARKSWKKLVIFMLIVLLIFGVAIGALMSGRGSDSSVPVNPAPAPQTDPLSVISDEEAMCQNLEGVELDEIGLMRFGDSLTYDNINTFWDENDQTSIETVISELFYTVGDGCTPQGAAYWRNIFPHQIDAERVGESNYNAATRIEAYQVNDRVRAAVSQEIEAQLKGCSSVNLVKLDAGQIQSMYVAVYTEDFSDVVFVQAPLLQIEEDLQGLQVLQCDLGRNEDNGDTSVDTVMISPSLRVIVFLEQPVGTEVIKFNPDDRNNTDDDTGEGDNPNTGDDDTGEGDNPNTGDDDSEPKLEDTEATPLTESPEPSTSVDVEGNEHQSGQPTSDENTRLEPTETDPQTGDEGQTEEEVPEVDEPDTTTSQEPTGTDPQTGDEGQTEEEVPEVDEPDTTTSQEPTGTDPQTGDEGQTEEEVPEVDEPDTTTSQEPTGTDPQTGDEGQTEEEVPEVDEPDTTTSQEPTGTDPQTGDEGQTEEEVPDGQDGTTGNDCQTGCPGENEGGDEGDNPGGSDGQDDCTTACPGGSDTEDGDGDKDPKRDPEPKEEDTCPPGWLISPSGACKAPDPGTDGF